MRLSVAFPITLAVVVLTSSCTTDVDNLNLIMNGDLELGTGGTPSGWAPTVVPLTADHVVFSWTEAECHTGDRCVSIAIQDDHPVDTGIIAYNWTQSIDDGFNVGETYQLGVWVKTEDLMETAWIVVQFLDSDQQFIDVVSTQPANNVVGTRDWTFVDVSFSIPVGTVVIVVRAGIAAPGSIGGEAWFDDFAITPTS